MVVFITAIIFTTATSMIALVTTDYKHRINDSKRLQNMYQAESGLDVTYNVITKNCDAAVVYANAMTRAYLAAQTTLYTNSDEEIYNAANNEFKSKFLTFLGITTYPTLINSSNYGEAQYNITGDELIYGILNNRYAKLKMATDGGTERDSTEDEYKKLTNTINGDYRYNWINIDKQLDAAKQEAKIEILSYIYNNAENKITIEVKSTFNSINNSTDGAINKKIISTKFIVNAPDYDQAVNTSSNPTDTDSYAIQKAIVADGNLTVTGGTTNVYGDVWIKGIEEGIINAPNIAYDKYRAGIFVNGGHLNVNQTMARDGTTQIGGNIYTNSTYNLVNNATSTINNNLYSFNTYVGPSTSGQTSTGNTLNALEVITNNDLTLNANNSRMNITNYYGINDISTANNGIDSAIAARDSSSIIVNNSANNSLIDITGAAYVAGVSYVNTNRSYATGESVGIKGNYLAYTDKLPNDNRKMVFENYSPLYMVAKMENETALHDMTPNEKADYFVNYYNSGTTSSPTNYTISSQGVQIGQLFAIGAYPNAVISTNTTTTPANRGGNIDAAALGVFKSKKIAYAEKVLSMGGFDSLNEDDQLAVYTNNIITDIVPKTVANQIKWTTDIHEAGFVEEYIPTGADTGIDPALTQAFGKFIFNKDASRTIRITSTGIEVGAGTTPINAAIGDDAIYQKAVIITNGNVVIEPGVQFKGSIIAGGNVTITTTPTSATTPTEIIYDEQLVLNITAKYATKIAGVFLGNPLNGNTPIVINAQRAINTSTPANGIGYTESKYDSKHYLKTGIWKIER